MKIEDLKIGYPLEVYCNTNKTEVLVIDNSGSTVLNINSSKFNIEACVLLAQEYVEHMNSKYAKTKKVKSNRTHSTFGELPSNLEKEYILQDFNMRKQDLLQAKQILSSVESIIEDITKIYQSKEITEDKYLVELVKLERQIKYAFGFLSDFVALPSSVVIANSIQEATERYKGNQEAKNFNDIHGQVEKGLHLQAHHIQTLISEIIPIGVWIKVEIQKDSYVYVSLMSDSTTVVIEKNKRKLKNYWL